MSNKHFCKGDVFELIMRGVGDNQQVILERGGSIVYVPHGFFCTYFELDFENLKKDKTAPFYVEKEGDE